MKPTPQTPIDRARHLLSIGLVTLVTASVAYGQTSDTDSLRRLQEENAALRKRLAELEGQAQPAPAPAPAPTRGTAPASTPAVPVVQTASVPDDGTVTLSPFEVRSEKDYGYLRTNSATATRIGTEIQKVPLSVTVLSEDFVKDAGMNDIQDVLRYISSASGDPRMGIRQPGNSATPSGTIMLRGFPISQRLRNGVFRYTAYSLDSIDRVEIIKGPASIFYGVGYPGGVINYVTKKPKFTKIPTTISYGYGGTGSVAGDQRMTLDHNSVLNDKTAFRIVGAWKNMNGDKNFEFDKGFSISPSVTIRPFNNNKLVITAEVEHTEFDRNQDDSTWLYDEQYFKDVKNPSASLLTAAGINPTAANALDLWKAKMAAGSGATYGTWVGFKRIELNNPTWAANRFADTGAYYNDLQGNRVHDEKFNYYGPGSYTNQKADTLEVTIDASPFSWLDARYVFTAADTTFDRLINNFVPRYDGNTFVGTAASRSGYYRDNKNHQLDLIVKKELFGVKNKLLVGGLFSESNQVYTGFGPNLYVNIPGAALYDPTLPDNGTTNIPPWMNYYNWGLAFQTLKDRNGNPLNAYNLYAQYDPALHPMPPTNRVTMPDRSIVDSGKPQTYEGYVNYLADLFKDRLHVMGGYRWTFNYPNGGQRASANPPWYNGTGNLYAAVDPSEWDAYGIGINSGFNPWVRNANGTYQPAKPLPTAQALGSYYQGTFGKTKGTSWMGGFSFDITPDISFYVSRSNSFRPSGGAGAIYAVTDIVQRAGELGLNSQAEIDRIRNAGSDSQYGNEQGKNTEFGFKTSLWDNKLVSTVSFFRLERKGEVLDDTARQLDDPLNWTGPNKTGSYARIVRWYSNGTTRRVEGGEVEVIWTPMRNYQVVASGSWLWKAKTLLDTSIAPTNTTALHYAYDYRMPGVSEYRFNMFNKYTFTRDYLRGLSVALGVRYASEMNIGNDTNWDSANGGLTAGDYFVFDTNLSYAWSLGGYKVQTTLNVTNLTDKLYAEGGGAYGGNGFSFSPPRTWMLTNTLSF